MKTNIIDMDAGELSRAVADFSLSAAEITGAFLERIETVDSAVNAICTLNPGALTEARGRDRRLASGALARVLEGVPYLVKDTIETRGLRTTFGSVMMRDHVPEIDAVVVERMNAAGAVLIGKTNTPEFATDVNTCNAIFGMTRNPWDLNATAGGSSGGTAAAVAAKLAPIGLGTDLGGSIRIPASFNGVVGLRPAPGRVPVYPQEFGWDTLVAHVCGPMAASIADIGLMLSVLAGPDDRDPSSLPTATADFREAAAVGRSVTGRRIAFVSDLAGLVPVDPQVMALVQSAAHAFEAFGCTVADDCFDVSGVHEIISGTRAFNMVARYAARLEAHEQEMSLALVDQVRSALGVGVRTVADAERLRTDYWHRLRSFLTRYDYVITPTLGVPAFRLEETMPTEVGGAPVECFFDVLLGTYAFSIVGLPVISVPCGWTNDGRPVGFQIVGPHQREDRVLEAASVYAAAHPEHFCYPNIDLESVRPVHPDFIASYSGFVGGATRMGAPPKDESK